MNCKTSYSKGTDFENLIESKCPQCGQKMTLVDQKFKPPKKSETKSWELVNLFLENGFKFQVVYEKLENGVLLKVNYPKNISEAKEFIKKYSHQIKK